jgi:hypothetical protein
MTICGYNEKMGLALELLFDGIYEAIDVKAREVGVQFKDILAREKLEIPTINLFLGDAQDFRLRMFLGLNKLALPFFESLFRDIDEVGIEFSRVYYDEKVREFISLLRHSEEFAESVPKSSDSNGIVKRAELVGRWICEGSLERPNPHIKA